MIIQRWYNTILNSLKDDEQKYIKKTTILNWFIKNAERYDNIRILKTKIENAIFEKLTQHFIVSNIEK